MTGIEAMIAQGWPLHPRLPHYDSRMHLHLSRLGNSMLTGFAGNGMHVGCIGVVIGWVLAYG